MNAYSRNLVHRLLALIQDYKQNCLPVILCATSWCLLLDVSNYKSDTISLVFSSARIG